MDSMRAELAAKVDQSQTARVPTRGRQNPRGAIRRGVRSRRPRQDPGKAEV